MIQLQIPRPVPDRLSQSRSMNMFNPISRLPQLDATMQLPYPSLANAPDLVSRTSSSAPLSPPEMPGSAVRVVALSASHGAGHHFGYQLPAIGNSRSVSAHTSPSATSQRQHHLEQQVAHTPRKKYSISPNLRVPATIHTPQEGLPQLAAEMTCLFWFESSTTLKRVLETASPSRALTPLVPDAHPTIGFKKWVATILTTTQVAQNVILLALLFIYRLKQINPTVKGKPGSEYRLLTVALMLGNKFLDDNTYTNKTWAEVSGISVGEVHIMEVEFLSNMRYSLCTSKEKWHEWHAILGKFGTFFARASNLPASGAAVSPSTPLMTVPPSLIPSPSRRKPTSPQTCFAFSPSHGSSTKPLFHPQASLAAVSPTRPLPELGPIVRKRSLDHGSEPQAKRQVHGFTSGPYTNAPPIPTLQTPLNRTFESASAVHRLPSLPSLHIPTPQHAPPRQVHSWSEALPNVGTCAMAMAFPPPAQWAQAAGTPASLMPHAFSAAHTPTGDLSCTMSPFPMSAGSSPVGAAFPTRQSPSYFLQHRQSPYRPVRAVRTLLVPPPEASIQNPARSMAQDQMQYQSLGRPMTERQTGYIPYLDHSPWAQANQTHQYNQLPIPRQPVFR